MAVNITITIPDAYVSLVTSAFTKTSGSQMILWAHKNDVTSEWGFTIPPQAVGETLQDFGKRFIRQLTKAVVDLVDYAEDKVRYDSQMSSIVPPVSDVPEGILT